MFFLFIYVCSTPLGAVGIVIFGSVGSVSLGSWSVDAVAEYGCIAFSFAQVLVFAFADPAE